MMKEVVTRRCSLQKVFLEISKNSQEHTRTRVSFLMKLKAEACSFIKKETGLQLYLKRDTCFPVNFEKISRTLFYRTPPVASSVLTFFKKHMDQKLVADSFIPPGQCPAIKSPPVNYHLAKFPPGKLPPGEFPPGQIYPW